MNNETYWRKYYRSKENRQDEPSATAKWARPRMTGKVVYDLGCGNGRDTDYFSKKHHTIGVDPFAPEGLNYEQLSWRMFFRKYPVTGDDTLYMRWFLHAIPETDQEEILRKWKGQIFIEAREADGDHPTDHWRRPVDSEKLATHMIHLGYDIVRLTVSDKIAVRGDDKPLVVRVEAIRAWT